MRQRIFFILSFILLTVNLLAEDVETTISVTFADFPKGTSYAENEKHDLGSGLVIYTTLCHFTEQLRIYSSDTYNGYVVSDPLPGSITRMSFKIGYKKDVLNVYGSTDKETWTLIKGITTTSTSYNTYSLEISKEKAYTCFKLDVKGDQQLRIESMSITYVKSDNNENENGDEDNDDNEEGDVVISAPIFNPMSTSFSTESLDVTISAEDGYEVYYTKDGSTPSYTSIEEYIGIRGNFVTIYASDSKVTLQAIAVDPTTGRYSDISNATYTYVPVINDGSEAKPYTVAEVKSMTIDDKGKWVRGTIHGTMVNDNIQDIVTSDFKSQSNIVIGNDGVYIPVQLPSNSNIRKDVNLATHPYLKGKEILVKGMLTRYCYSQGVKEPTEYKIIYDIPINSFGYASLFLDMPVSVPSGSVAYYCSTEGNYVNLFPIGNIIPSNIGVVIESTPNTICRLTYTTKANNNEESVRGDNQLVGFIVDTNIEDNNNAYYALNAKNNKIGFYIPQTTTDMGFIAKANKAYLKVPVEHEVSMFLIRREEETAIVPISNIADDIIYDLQGRIVSSPVPGIYIRGGKKFVIK